MNRKSKKWLEAVGSIPECMLCGSTEALQVAHNWENKGMGMKAPDYETARLCRECHYELDDGKNMSKDERHMNLSRAIVRTRSYMIKHRIWPYHDLHF